MPLRFIHDILNTTIAFLLHKNQNIGIVIIIATSMLLSGFSIFLVMGGVQSALAPLAASSLVSAVSSPAVSATPLATPAPSTGWWSDPAVIGAFIGLGGTILGLIVAIFTMRYQTRKLADPTK